ncbi:MAG: aminotransferase class I/II-fold pyridoxal phosphate-dependent enzyme [Spirochaetaceae bacterium]|jgi:aminotransferase|nr:aminotransferase class I/II-fold pyridoxal phosphate-dependent enzyme [Spirochaetaceae bacterium]
MSIECDNAGGINLAQGICDLPLEAVLARGAFDAMKEEQNHYTRYDGIETLRKQIALKAGRFNHIHIDDENIVVSCGATGAFYSTCYALFNPGDEIILFEPYYGYHEYTLMSLDLVPVFAPLKEPSWAFDVEEMQGLVCTKTKGIVICTPSNPCGKVFSKEDLDSLGDFCIKNDLIVITDEIYEYITFDGTEHISPASLEKFKGRTITVSGYSKTFSITGWRIGYCIADRSIIKWIGNASDLLYVCAPSPLQYGVARAIETIPESFYRSNTRKKGIFCVQLYPAWDSPLIFLRALIMFLPMCLRFRGKPAKTEPCSS